MGRENKGEGSIMSSNVYIIWGAPASGKTTHVINNKKDGDLVVDLDLIKQSISMQLKTQADDSLLDIAINIRDYLYYVIENEQTDCKNIWVVAGLPKRRDREELRDRLGATLIHKNTSKDECIRRAILDEERLDKDIQMQIIDRWFDIYGRDKI